ncbi:MAG: repeat-containing protein [Gemmatimonadetes bacterium]|nr:repeat-containing protein [Gemmatimonadota bacterium]
MAHDHAHTAMVGSVNFHNSGSRAAQAPFQQGVAWLHNFKYQEAIASFQQAERADSTLAIAYWLEALSYSHVMWNVENLPKSRMTLARLGATPADRLAKAKTERERAFGAAVEAFYADASLGVRARAYSDSLRALAALDTTDLEASAFAAHGAMMAWSAAPASERAALAAASRSLALRVFHSNPHHPGAAHYLTHVADMDPASAKDMLPFARAYDKIAPDADHALHMPSHVFLPLGLWHEVSLANERAWRASRAEVAHDKATGAELSYHTLEWLQYAYLQEGRWSAARALVDTARRALAGVPIADGNADARFAANVLAFTYSMESGDWSEWKAQAPDIAMAFAQPTPSLRAWNMTMTNAYQLAVAALMARADTASARAVAARFRGIADSLPADARRGAALRSAGELEAMVARAQGDLPRAVGLLRAASQTEAASFSTPPTRIPAHELLGEWLLQSGSTADAVREYQAALAARPNRSRAVLGLAHAMRAAGDTAGAATAFAQLGKNWVRADMRVRRSIGADRRNQGADKTLRISFEGDALASPAVRSELGSALGRGFTSAGLRVLPPLERVVPLDAEGARMTAVAQLSIGTAARTLKLRMVNVSTGEVIARDSIRLGASGDSARVLAQRVAASARAAGARR